MAVFLGIALGQRASGVPGPWLAVGWTAVLGVAAAFAVLAPLLAPGRPGVPTPARQPLLRRLVDALSRRDFTYLLFPAALLGWLGGFVQVAAVGTWGYAALVLGLRLRARAAAPAAARVTAP
jgi:hypothetical protein